MSNLLIGFPIYSDAGTLYTPTFSGGSWNSSLPLTNLQDRRLAKVARSTDATVASTLFEIDLKAARRIGCIALPKHTLSQAATVRFRGASSPWAFDALNLAGFSTTGGTTSRVAASTTASDGVPLDKIGDTDGANTPNFYSVVTLTGNAQKVVIARIAKDTSTQSTIYLLDVTASAFRLQAVVTWSGSVPSVAMTTGTLLSTTAEGNGVYRLAFLTTSATAANTNRVLIEPASTNAAATGTVFFGDVSVFDTTVDPVVYDSGYLSVWPSNVYPSAAMNAGDARIGGGYTAEEALSLSPSFTLVPSSPQTARYWRVNIADTGNTAGYIDLARLVLADSYIPSLNMAYGAKLTWSSESTRTTTDGGAYVHQAKPRRRLLECVLDDMPQDELLANLFEIARRVGTTEQLYVVFDPADATHAVRRNFLGVLNRIDALTFPYSVRAGMPLSVSEEL